MKNYKYKSFPSFNDHQNCKGHANVLLDLDYSDEEDREQVIKVLDNYIQDDKVTSRNLRTKN